MGYYSEEILDKIRAIAAAIVEQAGAEIVEMRLLRSRRSCTLRLLADKPEGGISLEECSRINQELSRVLDAQDVLEGESYILEVSSPGVDRPLFSAKDFLRARGRQVRVFLNQPEDGRWELEGEVETVKDDCLFLKSGDKTISLSLTKIKRAKQVI